MKGRSILLLLLACWIVGCAASDPTEERARRARKGEGDIVIGAGGPWSSPTGMLWEGMALALEQVNSVGGIRGRAARIVKGDDEGSVTVGQQVAQGFVDNPDMVAVIGHMDSYVSIPTSIIYEYHGMLMISPYSTNPKLTRQGFRRVFRTIPDDGVFGTQLARFAHRQGYEAVLVYYIRDDYGTGLANAFEKECELLGIAVEDRLAYDSFSGRRVFRKDLMYWEDHFNFDAIFVAGAVPQAAVLIRQARALGIEVPMFGGDGLDTPELIAGAGGAAKGTFVGSTFRADDPRPEARAFQAAFLEEYGKPPDAEAAQGYDTVMVLAQAMREADSTAPDDVAAALRTMPPWSGVTGEYAFDDKGDLLDREILIKVVRDGRLVYFGGAE